MFLLLNLCEQFSYPFRNRFERVSNSKAKWCRQENSALIDIAFFYFFLTWRFRFHCSPEFLYTESKKNFYFKILLRKILASNHSLIKFSSPPIAKLDWHSPRSHQKMYTQITKLILID